MEFQYLRKNLHMRFPQGRAKALTFSYDDNVMQNARLVEILNAHGMKGTFNLNSGLMKKEPRTTPGSNRMPKDEILALFADGVHEVAVHGLTHPSLTELPQAVCTYEVLQDRVELEKAFGRVIRGMAYPYGTTNDAVVECLKQCGIAYARTVVSTRRFDIPTDWLRLPATCHHTNPELMTLAKQFVETDPRKDARPKLFYLWGHSYEFDNDNNWNVIEDFTSFMSGREKEIWYATNLEIYDYIEDYRRLQFSADCSLVKNPAGQSIWFFMNGTTFCIAPGQTLSLEE